MSGNSGVYFKLGDSSGDAVERKQRTLSTLSSKRGSDISSAGDRGLPRRSVTARGYRGTTHRTFSRTAREFDDRLRRIGVQLTFFGLSGVFVLILFNQVCWNEETLAFFDAYNECTGSLPYKSATWLLTVLFTWRLVAYYSVLAEKKQWEWDFSSKSDAFWNSSLRFRFFFELLINIVQPVPFGSHLWGLGHNAVISSMFLRLYLLIRMLRSFSPVYRERHRMKEDTRQRGHFLTQSYNVDIFTVLKVYFYSHTVAIVAFLFFLCVVSSAYVMYLLEREFWIPDDPSTGLHPTRYSKLPAGITNPALAGYSKSPFTDLVSCVFFVAVTMTTLGYGDITPVSWEGQLFAVLLALLGIVLTSLIVGVITNKLTPTPFQKFVINYHRRRKTMRSRRHYAAKIIQIAFREKRKRRRVQIDALNAEARPDGVELHQLFTPPAPEAVLPPAAAAAASPSPRSGRSPRSSVFIRRRRERWNKHVADATRPWVKKFRQQNKRLFEIEIEDEGSRQRDEQRAVLVSHMLRMEQRLEELFGLVEAQQQLLLAQTALPHLPPEARSRSSSAASVGGRNQVSFADLMDVVSPQATIPEGD